MRKNQTVKALLFTLIFAFFAIGTIAIAKEVMKKEKSSTMISPVVLTETWYFQGGDPTNPDNYSDQPVENKPCGEFEEVICQISAPDSLGKPRMSATVPGVIPATTVAQQITDAAANPHLNETVLSFREE